MENKNKMVKKYTKEQMQEMNRKADLAVAALTVTGAGIGVIPIAVDIAALMAAMGTGVVGIGQCYDFTLSKENASDLIKQFFKAAGMTYSIVFIGIKMTDSLLKSNPITYMPFAVADGVICGAAAYAVGDTARQYFQRKAQGKKVSAADMKKWMEEGQKKGKELAKQTATEQAQKKQLELKQAEAMKKAQEAEAQKAKASQAAQAADAVKAEAIKAKLEQDFEAMPSKSAWVPAVDKNELTKGNAVEAKMAVRKAAAIQP